MTAQTTIGHNSQSVDEQMKEVIVKYILCDEKSAIINDERAALRKKADDLLGDQGAKALQDKVAELKRDMKKKEGYDEARESVNRILGEMDKDSLFAWQTRREKAKEEAKAEAKKLREAEAKKADEFKPATERKPKNSKTAGQIMAKAHPIIQ